jgi:hypothetical protein
MLQSMDERLALLDAIGSDGARTRQDVADQLGMDLRAAAKLIAIEINDGFVRWEADVSKSIPGPQQFLVLTAEGLTERERLSASI